MSSTDAPKSATSNSSTPGSYMKLSRELCAQYVTRQQLYDMTHLLWEIPAFAKPLLWKYEIQFYTGFDVMKMIVDGRITDRTGTRYDVSYYRCGPKKVYDAEAVAISFRKPLSDYRLPATAMIRIVNKERLFPQTKKQLEADTTESTTSTAESSESQE